MYGLPVFFLYLLGQRHRGAGTLDQVKGRAVAALNVGHPAVPGDIGHHLNAHTMEIVPDYPGLAGDVEIAIRFILTGLILDISPWPTRLNMALQAASYPARLLPLKPSDWTGRTGMPFSSFTLRQTAARSSPMMPTMQVE